MIKKPAYAAKYGTDAVDVYRYSLEILVERFCYEIGPVEAGGTIFAECRRPDLDRELSLAWEKLKRTGTSFVGAQTIDSRVIDLSFKEKRLDIAGLQLAALVVSPIGRAIMGKDAHEDWEVVKSKFRRWNGKYEGAGLVVLPRDS